MQSSFRVLVLWLSNYSRAKLVWKMHRPLDNSHTSLLISLIAACVLRRSKVGNAGAGGMGLVRSSGGAVKAWNSIAFRFFDRLHAAYPCYSKPLLLLKLDASWLGGTSSCHLNVAKTRWKVTMRDEFPSATGVRRRESRGLLIASCVNSSDC